MQGETIKKTQSLFVKTSRSMIIREIRAVDCDNITEHNYTATEQFRVV